MLQEYLAAVMRPDHDVNPLLRFLGISVERLEPDHAELHLSAKPELVQGAGKIAGGVIATLLDETMAHAVLAGNTDGERTSTVDMQVTYLRPVAQGEHLECTATVVKRGRRIIFVQGTTVSGGREVARATGTFVYA